jgi:NAD(P)H-hydrate epimerase
MKVLTADEMRDADRRAIELGIPGIVLMENASLRVIEFLHERFSPLGAQRIVVFCGKGNNGGDGFGIARHLLLGARPASLHVVFAGDAAELRGDAATSFRMFQIAGGECSVELPPQAHAATLVIDALLGTGIQGDLKPPYDRLTALINTGFPAAKIVAVDVPSGPVRADYTVTFVAPKIAQVVQPGCGQAGELIVAGIGTPASLLDGVQLHLSQPEDFRGLFQPRPPDSNKGMYGHVLVAGGSHGKTGAVEMTALAALRMGAGLVTVASEGGQFAPELMTASLKNIRPALDGKSLVAVGPGLGTAPAAADLVRCLFDEVPLPVIVDADGLNCLAGSDFRAGEHLRVLTPHPGEMSRLCGVSTREVQRDRLGMARSFAAERNVVLVLKGDRTVIALPDGRAWINPTGTPALATGGTGDVLTGLIAGLMAQSPDDLAVRAAVWLHGRAGELGAAELGEQSFIATDILRYLPAAIRECRAP